MTAGRQLDDEYPADRSDERPDGLRALVEGAGNDQDRRSAVVEYGRDLRVGEVPVDGHCDRTGGEDAEKTDAAVRARVGENSNPLVRSNPGFHQNGSERSRPRPQLSVAHLPPPTPLLGAERSPSLVAGC